jgi:hypothetical protein
MEPESEIGTVPGARGTSDRLIAGASFECACHGGAPYRFKSSKNRHNYRQTSKKKMKA